MSNPWIKVKRSICAIPFTNNPPMPYRIAKLDSGATNNYFRLQDEEYLEDVHEADGRWTYSYNTYFGNIESNLSRMHHCINSIVGFEIGCIRWWEEITRIVRWLLLRLVNGVTENRCFRWLKIFSPVSCDPLLWLRMARDLLTVCFGRVLVMIQNDHHRGSLTPSSYRHCNNSSETRYIKHNSFLGNGR